MPLMNKISFIIFACIMAAISFIGIAAVTLIMLLFALIGIIQIPNATKKKAAALRR